MAVNQQMNWELSDKQINRHFREREKENNKGVNEGKRMQISDGLDRKVTQQWVGCNTAATQ